MQPHHALRRSALGSSFLPCDAEITSPFAKPRRNARLPAWFTGAVANLQPASCVLRAKEWHASERAAASFPSPSISLFVISRGLCMWSYGRRGSVSMARRVPRRWGTRCLRTLRYTGDSGHVSSTWAWVLSRGSASHGWVDGWADSHTDPATGHSRRFVTVLGLIIVVRCGRGRGGWEWPTEGLQSRL
ncbi:hypothetical protein EJ04DRAFT_512229, partial [Polyplosphaeria fusca]